MKRLCVVPACLGSIFSCCTGYAIDLKQSRLTQVVNDVQIISAADQKQKMATVNDVFSMPDLLRTGNASRAELTASDQTVTRVGANTIFSFDPANRTIDLKQGSLLFHAPHGKGGGAIHTGSATASVLGTTLIVTTTPNGGFKVLALEGEVEVKFLNGLKQKLDPGQMTYVLPGGNKLAPVVIFRLDELTAKSLLVKGFNVPLDSMPLIDEQIEKQLKLIQNGKLGDTGLYAGEDAGPGQVQVLDINTIRGSYDPRNLAAAMAADATLNQPSLTAPSIPTPPIHVFADGRFGLGPNRFFHNQKFSGFIARNITFNSIGLDPLVVNLNPYFGIRNFSFVSVEDLLFPGSVTFDGLSSHANLSLNAGDAFDFAPGIALRADVKHFLLSSPATLSLNDVAMYNFAGELLLESGGDVDLQNGSLLYANRKLTVSVSYNISAADSYLAADSILFTALSGAITLNNMTMDIAHQGIFIAPGITVNDSTINAESLVLNGVGSAAITLNNTAVNASTLLNIFSANSVNINGGPNSALNVDPAAGSATLVSIFGSVNIQNTSLTTHYLTVNSGDGILLDCNGHTLNASGAGATAAFTAPHLVTINNADFSAFSLVNIAANTIVLANDIFSPTHIYNFASQSGSVAINGPNPGGLAIYNSLLGTTPITSANQIHTGGPGTSPGIYSYPR